MTKIVRGGVVLVSAFLFVTLMALNSFADSTLSTQTVKYIDNTTLPSEGKTVNPIILNEGNKASFANSGGYFTVTIPADVNLYGNSRTSSATVSKAITKSVLGSSSSKHNLYMKYHNSASVTAPGDLSATSGHAAVIFLYESASGTSGTEQAILTVYGFGTPTTTDRGAFMYGSADMASAGTGVVKVAQWGSLTTNYSSSGLAGGNVKVGEIYYNSTLDTIVMTLAGDARTDDNTWMEKIWLNNLTLIPDTAAVTGNIDVAIADASAQGLGLTSTSATVAELIIGPAKIQGAESGAANVPPTIPAGKIAGQAMGRLKITLVGAASSNTNVITVALDNGATFHTIADDTGTDNTLASSIGVEAITIASNGTATAIKFVAWIAQHPTASLAVNSAGKLVITLGTTNLMDESVITIPRSTTGLVIDTSGVTASGDITATVTGAGDLATASGTAVVASVQITGTTVSFKESAGAIELSTLYAGRTAQTTADTVQISETAPTSLLSGGTLSLAVNLGAKFTTATSLTATESTASGYTDTPLVLPPISIGAAAATGAGTVTAASTNTAGTYFYSIPSFNLTAATPGSLQVTVAGTAGASGTVTLATVINATASTLGSSVTVIPGSSVTFPDITITEQKYAALAAGKIGLKFPSGYTLDASGATLTVNGAASSAVTLGSVDASTESYISATVVTPSTTSTGAYTIVISGLTATTTTAAASGDVKIAGAATDTWTTTSATFGSNAGAKPTAQTLSFGTVISATVPSALTPVVSGTVVTQTFIPAGNDIGKVGDLYVFTLTPAQYYSGSAWTATSTPYSAGNTLGSVSVVYDVSAVAASTKVYIGYGTGVSGTEATMNTNGTFVVGYTTAVAPTVVPVAVGAGAGAAVTATINTTDTYAVTLTTTNAAGATPTSEWVAYQVIVSGTASGWWFMTATGSVEYTAGLDLSTVTYDTAAAGSLSLGDHLLGTYLPTAGDQLIIAYVYTTGTIDLADPTSYVVENVVTMTVQ